MTKISFSVFDLLKFDSAANYPWFTVKKGFVCIMPAGKFDDIRTHAQQPRLNCCITPAIQTDPKH